MPSFHVAVLGGGSVGLCLAASFAQTEAEVTLLVRESAVAGLVGQPLTVTGLLGNRTVAPGRVRIDRADTPGADALSADMLIVTTKAYDLADALRPFAEAPNPPALLLLQNGMGSAEIARGVMGPGVPIYSTAMMIGMVRQTPTDVAVTAQASPIQCGALLGDPLDRLDHMLALAETGFVPMVADARIRETIAFKLLFNSCMNPTGALIGTTYGALLENPDSRALITALAGETLAAYAAAYGYRPAESGSHYVDTVLSGIVFPRGAGHRSSMLQDIEAGRRTEIDVLNGAIVRLCDSVGLAAPVHRSIVSLIRAREAAERTHV